MATTTTTDEDRRAAAETHRLGRQVLDDAATVLGTRRRLDGLLLDSLSAPGLGTAQLSKLDAFMHGPDLARGRQALARCARAGGVLA